MRMLSGNKGSRIEYIAPAVIVLAILALSMAAAHVYPFGDYALVSDDGVYQYVGFMGWYHNVLVGEESLFYSFSKSLGGETLGLFAYYLSSPFSLLAFFFDASDSPKLFSLIIPLKIALASTTCYTFFRLRFGRTGLIPIVLGVLYALAACNLLAGSNVMWLDGLYMLPLMAYGSYKLVHSGKNSVLFVTTALAICFNWYTAYMNCVFVTLYIVAELVLSRAKPKQFINSTVKYFITMFFALGASAIVFVPAVFSILSSGSSDSSLGFLGLLTNRSAFGWGAMNPLAFFQGFSYQGISGVPTNLSMASFLIIGFLVFLLCPKISTRKKLTYGGIVGLLFISCMIKPLDMVWTGFISSDSYNPRYGYIIAFAMSICALVGFDSFVSCKNPSKQKVAICSVFLYAVLLVVPWAFSTNSLKILLCQIGVAALAITTLYFATDDNIRASKRHRRKKVLTVLLCSALLLDQTFLTFHTIRSNYTAFSVSSYETYMDQLSFTFEENSGDQAPRIETAGLTSTVASGYRPGSFAVTGENLALGIFGLSHYSSTGGANANILLGNLGYNLTPGVRNITYYNSPIYVTDAILGIGTVVAKTEPALYSKVDSIDLPEPYGDAYSLYRSANALSLGFTIPAKANPAEFVVNDVFRNQEKFVSALTGDQVRLYRANPVEVKDPISANHESLYTTNGSWAIHVETSGPLYIFFSVPQRCDLYCNDEYLQSVGDWEFDTNIVYVGTFEAGDEVDITLKSSTPYHPANVALSGETLDVVQAENAIAQLSGAQFDVLRMDHGVVEGTISSNGDDNLLLTIPYEVGWTAYIDGVETTINDFNGLISIDLLGEGNKVVTMQYHNPVFEKGIVISLVALLAFSLWQIAMTRRGLRLSRKQTGDRT